MAVDLTKPPRIIVVHGVRLGSGASIDCAGAVERLLRQALSRVHVERPFETRQYVYEDLNNDAQEVAQMVSGAILRSRPIARKALERAIDLVGDVVIAAANTSTAAVIRDGLRNKVLEAHDEGHQVVLVAHSLGTVYSLDVVSELLGNAELCSGDDSRLWPVSALLTLGSPLGLNLKVGRWRLFDKRLVQPVPSSHELFPWHNFFNRQDPVVSGRVFGTRVNVKGADGPLERRYRQDTGGAGWLLQPHVVTSGAKWLLAHTSYWKHHTVGACLANTIWG